MQTLSFNLENLNGQQQKYLIYLSFINYKTIFKMIEDNQAHWKWKYVNTQKENILS